MNMLSVVYRNGIMKRYANGRRISNAKWDQVNTASRNKSCFQTYSKNGRLFHRHVVTL